MDLTQLIFTCLGAFCYYIVRLGSPYLLRRSTLGIGSVWGERLGLQLGQDGARNNQAWPFPRRFSWFRWGEECKPVAVEVQQLQRRGTATSALDGSAHLWWLELRSSGREGLWVGKKCNWKAAFGLDMRPINFLMMFIRRPEVHRALR